MQLAYETTLEIPELSGVARLADAAFLVVDDERGLFQVVDGKAAAVKGSESLGDLEGVCVSDDGRTAYVLCERDGEVYAYDLDGTDVVGPARPLGALPRVGKRENRGWEGLAYCAAGRFGDGPMLMACHQRSPRRIGWFAVDDLTPITMFRLPKSARKQLDDLSDLTLDPDSGRLLVLSGKAGRVAAFTVVGDELEMVDQYRIATDKDDVPEGITAADGQVWIVSDGLGHLRRYDHVSADPTGHEKNRR